MVKLHTACQLLITSAVFFFHSRRLFQNTLDSVSAGNSLGHRNDQICQLHKLHQYLGHIIDQGNHLSLGQDTCFYPDGTHIDQCDQSAVDHHIS